MHRGILAYVIVIIIMVVGAFIYTGFRFLPLIKPPARTTSTINQQSTYTITTSSSSTTTTISNSIGNYSNSVAPCSNLQIVGQAFNTTYTTLCDSKGGTLGLWVASGNSGKEYVKIVGADNKTYVN